MVTMWSQTNYQNSNRQHVSLLSTANPHKRHQHRPTYTFLLSLLSSLPSLPLCRGLSLPPSACVRGYPGVSVMTMSQCSSLPISTAIIIQTHMELSITGLLHTGTHPPSRESERERETAAQRWSESFQQLYNSKRPHTVPISSIRSITLTVRQSHSSQGKCHETA